VQSSQSQAGFPWWVTSGSDSTNGLVLQPWSTFAVTRFLLRQPVLDGQ
jgi:hypothetical protein